MTYGDWAMARGLLDPCAVSRPRLTPVALIVSFAVAAPFIQPSAATAEDSALSSHVMMIGRTAVDISVAIEGAARRIGQPRCSSLLTDFKDAQGRPLVERLGASGMDASTYIRELRFVDGWALTQCHANTYTVAVTQPGSRVIYVCGARFSDSYQRATLAADAIVIHEFLHSLGLGEDPPSSEEISWRVKQRCGD
jgi:hypothetical protein